MSLSPEQHAELEAMQAPETLALLAELASDARGRGDHAAGEALDVMVEILGLGVPENAPEAPEILEELRALLARLLAAPAAEPEQDPAAQSLVVGQSVRDAAHWLNEWSPAALVAALEEAFTENPAATEAGLEAWIGTETEPGAFLENAAYSAGTIGRLTDTMPMFLGWNLRTAAWQLDALAEDVDPRTTDALQDLANADPLADPADAFVAAGRRAADILFARANKLHMELTGAPLNVQMPSDRVQGTVTAPPTGPDPALPEPPVVTPTIEVDAGTVFALIVRRPTKEEAVDLLTGRMALSDVVARTVNTFASRAEAELASAAMLSAAQQTRQDRKTEVGLAVKSVKAGEVLSASDADAKADDLILAFTANPKGYSVEEVVFVDEEVVPVETPVGVAPPMGSSALGPWVAHLDTADVPVGMPVSIADTIAAATAAIFTGVAAPVTPASTYVGLIQQDANLKDLPIEDQQRQTDAAQVARQQRQQQDDVDASDPQTYWTKAPSTSDLPRTKRAEGVTVEGEFWSKVLIPAAGVAAQLDAYAGEARTDAEMKGARDRAQEQEPTGPTPEPAPTVHPRFTILDGCRVIVDHASITAACTTLGYAFEGAEGGLLLITTPEKETLQAEPYTPNTPWPNGTPTYELTALGESLGGAPQLPVSSLLGALDSRTLSQPIGGSLIELLASKCDDGGDLDVGDVLGAFIANDGVWQQLAKNDFDLEDGWTERSVVQMGTGVEMTLLGKGTRQEKEFDFKFLYTVWPDGDRADVEVRFYVDNVDSGSTTVDGRTLEDATSPASVFLPFAQPQFEKAYPWWHQDLAALQRDLERRLREREEAQADAARASIYMQVRNAAEQYLKETTERGMVGDFSDAA